MKKGRRNFPAKFKAKVALEAVTGGQTLAELSIHHCCEASPKKYCFSEAY